MADTTRPPVRETTRSPVPVTKGPAGTGGQGAAGGGGGSRRGRRDVLVWLAVGWLVVVAAAAVAAPWLPVPDPDDQDMANRLAGPLTAGHVLGTDGLGRDVLARLAHGARVTVAISVSAVTIGLVVGGTLGLVAGVFRGLVDAVTMWAANVILAFPGLVLLLGLVAFVGRNPVAITLVIGFLSVPTYVRVTRAATLAVSQRDYVLAARAMGARRTRIVFGEILPNVAWPAAAFGLVALGTLIVVETSLAFLGLSVDATSWGQMIAQGRRHMSTTVNPVLAPAVVVFLTVLTVNFVGDVLRSRFEIKESNL